jgi:small subunit ribosomal protein S20
MANHKSSKKRIRQTETKRLENKYYHRTTRNAVKALRGTTDKAAAEAAYAVAVKAVDQAVNKGLLHKNNAARKKSSLTLKLNALA